MTVIFCACCGRPFQRSSTKGPAPRYCSTDCRRQMAVRRSAWSPDWDHIVERVEIDPPIRGERTMRHAERPGLIGGD